MMIQLYHYFLKKIGLTMKSLDVRFDNIRLTIKKLKQEYLIKLFLS